jgi:hypothetical protein
MSVVLGLPAGASASTGLLERPEVEVADTDGDGRAEATASGAAGGPCACRCPVMGGGVDTRAAGQTLSADGRSALVVCGTRMAVGVDPADPDVLLAPRAEGRLRFNPGGLGRGGPSG